MHYAVLKILWKYVIIFKRGDILKITNRYEYKYRISYLDYISLKPKLASIMKLDDNSVDSKYHIRSIYFDDIHYSGVLDKISGNELHKKYRVRYYNEGGLYKLEMKKKSGNYTEKTSTVISKEVFDAIVNCNHDVLFENFDNKLIRKFTLDSKLHNLEPKCFIDYDREAYISEAGDVRVTFDFNLKSDYYDINKKQLNHSLFLNTEMILEVKYTDFLMSTIKNILNTKTLVNQSYSKYLLGMNALHY